MARYVVAVSRKYRDCGVSAERVRDVPGVEVKGAANPKRVLIEASPKAVDEVRRRFGDKLSVEREIVHHRLIG